jgi:hypothetical protein
MRDELNTDPRSAFPRLWAKHDPSLRAFVRASLPGMGKFGWAIMVEAELIIQIPKLFQQANGFISQARYQFLKNE